MGNALLARLGLATPVHPVDPPPPEVTGRKTKLGRMGSIFRAASSARKSARKRHQQQSPREILEGGEGGGAAGPDQKLLPVETGVHHFPEPAEDAITANWMSDGGRRRDQQQDLGAFEQEQQVGIVVVGFLD